MIDNLLFYFVGKEAGMSTLYWALLVIKIIVDTITIYIRLTMDDDVL